jgi:hypothetical protein
MTIRIFPITLFSESINTSQLFPLRLSKMRLFELHLIIQKHWSRPSSRNGSPHKLWQLYSNSFVKIDIDAIIISRVGPKVRK